MTVRAGGWRATVLRPSELGGSELEAWHRFQGADLDLQNPFLSPEFACAADAARPDVRVAVVEHDGQLAGFLAHTAGRAGVAGPVAPGMCDVQAFVHRPGLQWVPEEVVGAAGLRAWRFDHLVGDQAAAGGSRSPAADAETWVIDLSGGWDSYARWAKAERGRYLNWLERKCRRFELDQPETSFTCGADDPAGFRALLALKSDQCRRMGWADFLGRHWVRELVERLAHLREPALCASVSALRIRDRVIAADFSLRSETVYAGWLIAYDHELASSSPGAVRWRRLLEAVATDGIQRVDLGKGADEFKRRFATGTRPLAEGMWPAEGAVPRALASAERRLRRAAAAHPAAERSARRILRSARRRLSGSPRRAESPGRAA